MREARIQRWLSTGVCGAVIVVSLGWAQAAQAKTPDGETPHTEHICEAARLTGQAYGMCNAYCEAQDCDVHERASCERLRRNFERKTGLGVFPCDCADSFVFDLDAGCVCDPDLLATCHAQGGEFDPATCDCFFAPCDSDREELCLAIGGELDPECECTVPLCGDRHTCAEGLCPEPEKCIAIPHTFPGSCGCFVECGFDAGGQCGGMCPDFRQSCTVIVPLDSHGVGECVCVSP